VRKRKENSGRENRDAPYRDGAVTEFVLIESDGRTFCDFFSFAVGSVDGATANLITRATGWLRRAFPFREVRACATEISGKVVYVCAEGNKAWMETVAGRLPRG